jgi:coniferyl-aldehyde dehydrogenase
MFGKTLNAGQICLAPDYVMVPRTKKDEFVESVKEVVSEYYPTLKDNNDYTSIINQNHYDRLNGLIEDARNKGAIVETINPSNDDFSQQEFFKIPPTLISNVEDDMDVMKEEIFGPILPIKEYDSLDETIEYVNKNDKPLGLYYFGTNKKEESDILEKTSSGGVTVNNVLSHLQQGDLPFGGVGPSGIGQYDGHDGFKNFSNQKAVYKDISLRFDSLFSSIRPPYKGNIEKVLKSLIK